MRRNPWPLVCFAAALAWAPGASAGVVDFVATCLADGAAFDRLPARLAAQGWVERAPTGGAQGPALAATAARRRLWSLPGWNGDSGDAYTGLVLPTADRPMEMCWHVSRPGESGARSLGDLRRRYPPIGAAERHRVLPWRRRTMAHRPRRPDRVLVGQLADAATARAGDVDPRGRADAAAGRQAMKRYLSERGDR